MVFVIRVQFTELFVGLYLCYCGVYDIMYGRDHFWIYLFMQAVAFFIVGLGWVGTIVPTCFSFATKILVTYVCCLLLPLLAFCSDLYLDFVR